MSFPENNRTYQIIHAARKGNYSVGGFCVYNADGVEAVVRAAEARRSPAVLQLFPWSMHHQGRHFVAFAAAAAHGASVPIALHLDHCLEPADAELALGMPFDSIMVDGSQGSEADNAAYVRDVVAKAAARGVTVEAELGRMEGGYADVLAVVAAGEGVLTEPDAAARFVAATGVHFLAPSFGNVHGPYPGGEAGAERCWQLDRVERIRAALPADACPLVLHGTAIGDGLLRRAMAAGMVKANQNKRVRRRYGEYLAGNAGRVELTELHDEGVRIYADEVGEMMELLGSAGKA